MSDDTPDDDQSDATITIEVRRDMMENSRYSVVVRRFRLGQLRIQLCNAALPDAQAPAVHGAIVRELCTNQWRTMQTVLLQLRTRRRSAAPWRRQRTASGRGLATSSSGSQVSDPLTLPAEHCHGARTPEGLERCRRATWKHGRRSAEAIAGQRLRGHVVAGLCVLIREAEAICGG